MTTFTTDLENYKIGGSLRSRIFYYKYTKPKSLHLFDNTAAAAATTTNPINKYTKYTPNKSYKCSICDQLFSRNHDLKRHQRIHTDFKPFHCYCGKSFSRKDALKRHLLVKGCQQQRN